MPGLSFVTAEYYRARLADLRARYAELQATLQADDRREVARLVRHSAMCLMRSDAADVTADERIEAEWLVDSSAGYLARHGLTAPDEVRVRTIEAYRSLMRNYR